jgi:ubiquinone/menaquinone biosynthesis C-methylase UbiE
MEEQQPDPRATAVTRRRYQRIASLYDLMEFLPERKFSHWRGRLWSMVKGTKVLEVGVGTGKNMPFYAHDMDIVAIDLTPGMLERARKRSKALNKVVDLQLGDVQNLEFPDAYFDTVVATFVFCSVPDPVLGLYEVRRVLKPGGYLLILEHVRSENPVIGWLMDLLNPLLVRIMGANINRQTIENVLQSGLIVEQVENLGSGDIFKLIVASRASHYEKYEKIFIRMVTAVDRFRISSVDINSVWYYLQDAS